MVADPDRSLTEELDDLAAVIDEDLQIIDVVTYERTLEKLERITEYHRSPDTTLDAPKVVAEHGIEQVMNWIDCITVTCPSCGEEMTKDSTRTNYEPHRQVYECPDGHYTVLPDNTQLEKLEDGRNYFN